MIQYLYNNDIILYGYAGLCGLGLFLRFIVNMVYKHLVKQSKDLGKAKNKMLKYIKLKFEACYRLKIGVNNVDRFVDKNVLRYRFCGLLLSTWENFCGQILFLNLLACPILAVFGVIYKCGQTDILFNGVVGVASGSILIIVDKSINLSIKKNMFRINMLDYLENFCKVRLEQEAASPELVEQHRREYEQVMDVKKQVSATVTSVSQKDDSKDELNRRREAKRQKEEEKKRQAALREEEVRKAEEARKAEELRRQEEKKQLAAKRREEERMKLEEERKALEERRAELKRKAQELQYANEVKRQIEEEKSKAEIISKPERVRVKLETIKEEKEITESTPPEPVEQKNEYKQQKTEKEMELLQPSLEEVAAEIEKPVKEVQPPRQPAKQKSYQSTSQDDKLLEDVLKEFFS